VHDVWIDNAVLQSQIIEKIEHVFDGNRQDTAAVHRAEYRLEQAVDVLLQGALRKSTKREINPFNASCSKPLLFDGFSAILV